MSNPNFLVKLTKFANTIGPNMRMNHSVFGVDEDYPCLNPEGPVDNSECPDDDPLCNCPCQELKPTTEAPWWDIFGLASTFFGDTEPSDEDIEEKYNNTKECDYIKDVLGDEYIGCLWSDPENPMSCDCPCVGDKFKDYVEYNRTYSTYWDTPKTAPLWRNAQMQLLTSQMASVVLNGDLTLRPGKMISIANVIPGTEDKDKNKKFTGRWMVSGIEHVITAQNHNMSVVLVRDSTTIDPNKSEVLGVFDLLKSVLGLLFSW